MRRLKLGELTMTYSEILRVIGSYIDRSNLIDVRLLETDEGILIQGRMTQGARVGQCDTYQLTPEDLEDLLHDARAQRGKRL